MIGALAARNNLRVKNVRQPVKNKNKFQYFINFGDKRHNVCDQKVWNLTGSFTLGWPGSGFLWTVNLDIVGLANGGGANLNIKLVLGWFMQMMFFGFDGVRNHRRKRKARKVGIHFASTDNDRNGSLFPLSCSFAPARWRKTRYV